MSQYNPKFFSREHISSISEALNQVLNGGTNSTHLTEEDTTSGRESGFGKGKTLIQPDNTWDEVARKDSGVASWAKRNNLDPATVDLKRENGKIYANGVEMTSASTKTSGYATGAKTRSEMNQKPAATPKAAPTGVKLDTPKQPANRAVGPTPGVVVPGRGGVPTDAVPYHPVNNPQGSHGEAGGHAYEHGPKRLDVEIPKPLNSSPSTSGVKGVRPHYQTGVPDSVQPSALPFHPEYNPNGSKTEVAGSPYKEGPMSITNQANRRNPQQNKGVERVQESLVEAIRNLIRRNYR